MGTIWYLSVTEINKGLCKWSIEKETGDQIGVQKEEWATWGTLEVLEPNKRCVFDHIFLYLSFLRYGLILLLLLLLLLLLFWLALRSPA